MDEIIFPSVEQKGCRDGFGDALLELGEEISNMVVLTADLAESTRVEAFGKKYPQRFVDVGVAEQNLMGLASGLALGGKIPFISSYATFSPGRNWDQLRVSVCYSNLNVKIIGAHAGISVGPDGATHQALEDLAMTRVLPNLVVMTPCDYEQAKKMTKAAARHLGPVYIRFGREKTPVFTLPESKFEIGKANLLREGNDVTIFACGSLVYEAIVAAEELAQKTGKQARVVNVHTIKPLDQNLILESAKKTKRAVVVEEHQQIGGLFGAISEFLSKTYPIHLEPVGMPDVFGESGKPSELLEKYGMSKSAILEKLQRLTK